MVTCINGSATPSDLSRRELIANRRRQRAEERPIKGRRFTALVRAQQLCDTGSFVEQDPTRASCATSVTAGATTSDRSTEGVVVGIGRVHSRRVVVISHDFGTRGGSIGAVTADKVVRGQDIALDLKCPIVYLNDSGGARIHEAVRALDGCGRIFARNVRASEYVPQISVILGPCAGAAAYSPALTDWTIMVRGSSQMFLTGPDVVRSATGEIVSAEELGGAGIHTEQSGVAHIDVDDEASALSLVRMLLGFLPQTAGGSLPCRPAMGPAADPTTAESMVPAAPGKPFNMRRVLATVVDEGSTVELMSRYGASVLTGLARLDGVPVGIVASQPKSLGGVLDVPSSIKAARLVDFCGRFGIPVLTFVDVPGFLPGSSEERKGIITSGASLVSAYARARCIKLTVIVRKAYGGAYIAMGSRSLGAHHAWAWAGAEVAVMGPHAAVGILHRDVDPEHRPALVDAYRDEATHPLLAAEAGMVDDVILPEETRDRLVAALRLHREERR